MRRWVGVLGVLLFSAASLLANPIPRDAIAVVRLDGEMRGILTRDYEIEVVLQPHPGDAWTRLALRVTGDASRWEEIAQYNGADDNLRAGQPVRVPYALLRANLQREIIQTLFPADKPGEGGWSHTVVAGRGIEGETLWQIAEWFTGDGGNYTAIRKANPAQGLSTRKGDVILIPQRLLTAAFGGGREGENVPTTAAEVRKPGHGPAQRSTADEDALEAAMAAASVGPPSLSYERHASEPYAVYRLQKGEALYSSVAIRFTGRVYAKDVNDVIERIVSLNGIEDVSRLPVGYKVKIPMDLLLPEYLPAGDPARLASEAARRASAQHARRTRARNLTGVHVILDAGHGGRDPGTAYGELWESTYVYDVACRLKELLEKKSGAKVSMTTRSKRIGFMPSRTDGIRNQVDHYVQTSPRYDLEDAIVGVNLRWYLANSLYRKTVQGGTSKEKVVFISIHADSLHPSLRGAMAYIPGGRFVKGKYEKSEPIYLARAEVRERPAVRQSESEALAAEGLSRDLAASIIRSFEQSGLQVHPFNPVRDNVVREGREWVPAIIRYNVVPTRLLLEVGNLGNKKDRELIRTRKHRTQLAEAIYRGLTDFYTQDAPGRGVVASSR
ncbi:MAG TPA: N-acetylmuramoyl-L-alanine amidase [Thermoanaerobaculia bacterium]|nr:N-acetylmuramoyl-L-alanine amidase [Thermoanaerobaculia bacterium]